MPSKQYISSNELLEQSYKLADLILASGFKPKFIVGIWRGGAPIGIAVQEYLKYFGINSDHICIRTSSYTGVGDNAVQTHEIRVHGLEYIIDNAQNDDSLLLIDDIFDSGRSVKAVIDKLRLKMRCNLPKDIRVGTVLYKPKNNKTTIIPDYFVEETDKWVVFPHELEDMDLEEIKLSKGESIHNLIMNRRNCLKDKSNP
jgi:hypoxanthine phosphoribosyltransferase